MPPGRITPRNRWILHFTHIDNLPAIAASGNLVCDVQSIPGLPRTDVGDPAIKAARRQRGVPAASWGCVGDYVPFYFGPLSPMMFRIACEHRDGATGRYPDGDRPLVYLARTVGAVLDAGLRWVVADGNAATATTEFGNDLARMDAMVDWHVLSERLWNNTPSDPDRQRRRMAEFLVHDRVPLSVIRKVATYDDRHAGRARAALRGHRLPRECLSDPPGITDTPEGGEEVIEVGRGNLLDSDVDALVNTVNTVGVMGKGIALQFKRADPANFRAYRAACARGEVRLGEMFVFDTGGQGPRRYILNFPTKQHWRNASLLADISAGLDALVDAVHEYGISSIAIPALGCGNGGLAWAQVRPLIGAACERIPHVRALVFAPEGPPAPEVMPNATPRPRLTAVRALLLLTIARYLDRARLQEVRDGVSELEIQKLAYFLQLLGAPMGLQFARGHYGPYSHGLGHVLNTLEGHYLTGFGDHTTPVTRLAPINVPPRAVDAADALVERDPDGTARIRSVLKLVDGFETPYSLELLGTVHFASIQEPPTGDATELAERIGAWSLRKARLFTESHVRIAADRLREHALLTA